MDNIIDLLQDIAFVVGLSVGIIAMIMLLALLIKLTYEVIFDT
jgi:hypothetical protein